MQILDQSHLTIQTMQSTNWYTYYTMQTIPHLQEATSSLEQGCDLCRPISKDCDCPCPIILPDPISITEADMTPSDFDDLDMITIIDLDSGRHIFTQRRDGHDILLLLQTYYRMTHNRLQRFATVTSYHRNTNQYQN